MEKLKQVVEEVGAEKNSLLLPKELVGNPKLEGFINWLATDTRRLYQQSKDYQSMCKKVNWSELPANEKEIADGQTVTDNLHNLRSEATTMEEELKILKEELSSLHHIHKQLSNEYESSLIKKQSIASRLTKYKSNYEQAVLQSKQDMDKLSVSLDKLQTSVNDTISLHVVEGNESHMLSTVPQDAYHEEEDKFVKELTNFTKKQFFQNIAKMVDLSESHEAFDTASLKLLQGLSNEEYLQHKKELERLQAIYQISESQRISNEVSGAYYTSACRKARQDVENVQSSGVPHTDIDNLKQLIDLKKKEIAAEKSRANEIMIQLPDLLQDMATLQITQVLHGDYDLKLARQNYFSKKQDEVIEQLQYQHSRHELLSMLLEVELRHHRHTQRLLLACLEQLTQWKSELERKAIEHSDSVQDVSDYDSSVMSDINDVLGEEFSSHSSVHSKISELIRDTKSVKEGLKLQEKQLEQMINKVISVSTKLQNCIFGNGASVTAKPCFVPPEYEETVSKLQMMLATLERDVKAILKDYQKKKQILQASPLLVKERELFIHFFTNEQELVRLMNELQQSVDALAIASKAKHEDTSVDEIGID